MKPRRRLHINVSLVMVNGFVHKVTIAPVNPLSDMALTIEVGRPFIVEKAAFFVKLS